MMSRQRARKEKHMFYSECTVKLQHAGCSELDGPAAEAAAAPHTQLVGPSVFGVLTFLGRVITPEVFFFIFGVKN